MSAIHDQLPKYAFGSVKLEGKNKSTGKAASAKPASQPQQQAQNTDSKPAAVPGYN